MTSTEKQELLFKCGRVFSPATPISARDLFAGRTEQIGLVSQAVHARGRHAAIFGERGVGKTSLANILKVLLGDEDTVVVKVNCHNEDSFHKLWKSALSEIEVIEEHPTVGFVSTKLSRSGRAADVLEDKVGPDDIRRVLQPLSRDKAIVIIFDEFDRLQTGKIQRLFADTIKTFSDNDVNTTFIVVGVANDVSELISEHASVDRSLVQIPMPRMKIEELREIIARAMQQLGMTMEEKAIELLVLLSQGLPHYTHLLGQESTVTSINNAKKKITIHHVKLGIESAIKKTQYSILEAYQNATRGQRKGTLFRQALLACALAKVDEQGYFVSAAVRDPLSKIMKKTYDIPGFSQHLDKFSSDATRGPVLEKAGTARRFRFRFKNPLLQPYVIMRGLSEGTFEGDMLEILRARAREEND